jgi:hypothetical protein
MPGCIWAVAFTAAEELVAGTSDSNAYIWTRAPDKLADAETLKEFETALAACAGAGDQAQGSVLALLIAVCSPSILCWDAIIWSNSLRDDAIWQRKGSME